MAERSAKLNEERLKLIRRFMGESADEEEEPPGPPVAAPPLDPRPTPARRRPPRPGRGRVSQAHQPASLTHKRASLPRPRVVSAQQLATGLIRLRRSHFAARWPLASVILGVVVGVLIARVV
jgi:hypothetical protein